MCLHETGHAFVSSVLWLPMLSVFSTVITQNRRGPCAQEELKGTLVFFLCLISLLVVFCTHIHYFIHTQHLTASPAAYSFLLIFTAINRPLHGFSRFPQCISVPSWLILLPWFLFKKVLSLFTVCLLHAHCSSGAELSTSLALSHQF